MSKMTKPATAQEIIAFLRERDIHDVKVGVFDIDGIFRGKYIVRDKLESALQNGFGFCNVVIGWGSNDQLYDNVTISGWSTGYRDVNVRLVEDTLRFIPFENDIPLL